jgi:hypothetical protein
VNSGFVEFVAEDGRWGTLVTRSQPIDVEGPLPITMMVIATEPRFFREEGGNVALTAHFEDDRTFIAVTNISQNELRRLRVGWWAFQT